MDEHGNRTPEDMFALALIANLYLLQYSVKARYNVDVPWYLSFVALYFPRPPFDSH